MKWTVLCLLVCIACGEEKKEESKPKPVPTVQPPPVESLAAIAPAETVAVLVHEEGAVRIQTPPDWLAED